MSVKQVTEHLLCSPSKISRIETGQRGATLRDVRDLCDLYAVAGEAERERLMTLAKEGKQQGWWQSYDLPDAYSTYVGLEAEAISIKDFDSAVIPGLLQTADYARAMCRSPLPEPGLFEMKNDVIEQRVGARLRRQKLLEQRDHRFEFRAILDEAALQRVVGSLEIMHEQLDHLIKASRTENITVQILPFKAGAHPALDSTFNILEFDGPLDDVVYVEGLQGYLYLERRDEVDRYRRVFARLSEMALNEAESIDFLKDLSDSYAKLR